MSRKINMIDMIAIAISLAFAYCWLLALVLVAEQIGQVAATPPTPPSVLGSLCSAVVVVLAYASYRAISQAPAIAGRIANRIAKDQGDQS